MFLKKFELQGFKSFADKTTLEFNKGISTIVGPNGSGKSNISDAIMWVMGEQRMKSLRGSKVQDIIFSGSDTRKALGMAAVSITMDNQKGILPLPYEEVTVTRKAFRSGESEFLINKTPCRLKDIQNLFHDTGIGRDSFAMIGQGRVQEIITSKPEERRAMLEELAGIVKYRNRKNEALRKIDQTEQNLVRVLDIISELKVNLEPLGEEAEKAEIYLNIKDELNDLDINLLARDIAQGMENQAELEASIAIFELQTEKLETDIASKEATFEKERLEIDQITEHLSAQQATLYEMKNESQQTTAKMDVSKTMVDNLIQRKERISLELKTIEEKLSHLREMHQEKTEQHQKLKDLLSQKEQVLEKINQQLKFLGETKKNKDLALENLNAQSLDEMQYIANLRNEYNKIIYEKESNLSLEDKNKLEATSIKQSIKKVQTEIENSNQTISDVQDNYDLIEQQLIEVNKTYQDKQLEGQLFGQKLARWQKELQDAESRKKALKDIQKEHAGYFYGVKNLLLEKDKKNSDWSGIVGVIADLISIDKKYVQALESALGNALQHVVTTTQHEAQRAIGFLKENRAGRATFLPLDTIVPRELSERYNEILNIPGVLGTANQLIQYDQAIVPAISHLLGSVVVTNNLEAAIAVSKKAEQRLKIVTLDGDVINPGGAMSGGHQEKKNTSILSRKAEISELRRNTDDLHTMIKNNNCDFELLASEIENVSAKRTSLKEKKQQVQEYLVRIKQEKSFIEKQLQAKKDELEIYTLDEIDLSKQKESINITEYELLEKLKEAELKKKTIDKNMLATKQAYQETLSEYEIYIEKRNKLNLEKVSVEEKENAMQTSLSVFYDQEQDLDLEVETMTLEMMTINKKLADHDKHLVELNQFVEKKADEVEKLIFSIQDEQRKKEELADSVREKSANSKELRRQLNEKNKQLHQNQVKLAKQETDLENRHKRLEERHELNYDQAKEKITLIDDIEAAEKRLRALKREMAFLGTVNLASIDEYARVSERYYFLNEQEVDLRHSIEKLALVIAEIDGVMADRFKSSFDEVADAFQHSFEKLFGGGEAKLFLTEPDNLLDTGVDIEARPPGKGLKNMNLLSGGEKALTAIALLFAFLTVKPSPFCVLDEIDAALDETNVNHFSNYLKTFSKGIQFVVISHRQGTIENADTLYGVTMDKKSGVTKMISVKLADKETTPAHVN